MLKSNLGLSRPESRRQMEGAMEVFAGGVTTYTINAKIKILKVDAKEAERCDCVSPKITEEMALAVSICSPVVQERFSILHSIAFPSEVYHFAPEQYPV